MSKSRVMVDEILRSLSRLNGQAQDILIHSYADTSDFRAVELMRYTMEQCQSEMESLRVKMDKIIKMMGHQSAEPSTLVSTLMPPAPVVEPPAPVVEPPPAVVPKVEAKVFVPALSEPSVPLRHPSLADGWSEPARKPRIRINIPEPKEVEKPNVRVSFPVVRRR